MKRNTGESIESLPWPGGRVRKSSTSLPLVNTPGWPVMSTARTVASSRAAFSASAMAWYMATVSAFFFSGRAISMVATPLMVAVLMLTGFSSVRWVRAAQAARKRCQ